MLAILAAVPMGTSIMLETAQRANFLGKVEQDRHREIEWQRERDLMAVIFHEVRNPLNGTVGHLRLAHAALEGKAATEGKAARAALEGKPPAAALALPPHAVPMLLENIENAMTCTGLAVEFLQAVSAMEKLQRADLPSPKHTPVLLPQVLREAATVVTPQLTEGVNPRIIDEHVTNGPAVLCDRTLLIEICINLLQNASRFTLEGYLELSCRIVEGGDATEEDQTGAIEVEIAVRDTGTGMSEDEISKICDRYQSVGGRGNFGLGLYLTHRQVSLLGSALRVRSPWQEGQTGSEFAFNLTLRRSVEPSDRAPATRSSSPSKNHTLPPDLRVLLADDVKTNRKLIRLALTRHCGERWDIVEASTGEEALQTFKSESGQARPFELLLLDETYSPEPSALRGSDVIKAVREHEQATDTPPVAIISCTGNTQDKNFLLECGADSVWEKPMPDFRDGSMQEALSEVLMKRQVQVRSLI
jgi:signal transduction histidine kinase/CheY-like chemotaxis protein